jgi:hypothetical protein
VLLNLNKIVRAYILERIIKQAAAITAKTIPTAKEMIIRWCNLL